MTLEYTLFGFDIRTPGVVGCKADLIAPADAPFRPAANSGAPWLTFDKYVNPSVFVSKARFSADKHVKRILVPEHINAGFDLFSLWDNLVDRIAHYPKIDLGADAVLAYATVDLSANGLLLPSDDTIEILTSRTTAPNAIAGDWALLGYDVVSAYSISALAGYRHSNSSAVFIQRIRDNLNKFGLISAGTNPDKLVDIVESANAEINEDPFFLVALYLVWANNSSVKKSWYFAPEIGRQGN